jgi:cytochrome P450
MTMLKGLAFPTPDEFRLDRDLRHHVAFGAGVHYCLGAPLARAEASITLHTFLDRFPVLTRGPRSGDRPLYAFRGGLRGAGASSTASKTAANIERGF